jgi:hypothetical protein
LDCVPNMTVSACFRRKQCFYFTSQFRICAANLVQQSGAPGGVAFDDAMKQILNLRPALRSQSTPTDFASRD